MTKSSKKKIDPNNLGAMLAALRTRKRRKCPQCGKLRQMLKTQKFCSDKCRFDSHNAARKQTRLEKAAAKPGKNKS